MSIPDRLTEKYLRLVSGFDAAERDAVLALKPRDAKAALARQLVKRLHGGEASGRAEADFDTKFRKREMPEAMPDHEILESDDLVKVLVDVGFAKSRGLARQVIEQGGVRVNGQKVGMDWRLADGDVLQAGKRNFVRIRLR
jgi:tyrosyl-tRNA synthetase